MFTGEFLKNNFDLHIYFFTAGKYDKVINKILSRAKIYYIRIKLCGEIGIEIKD